MKYGAYGFLGEVEDLRDQDEVEHLGCILASLSKTKNVLIFTDGATVLKPLLSKLIEGIVKQGKNVKYFGTQTIGSCSLVTEDEECSYSVYLGMLSNVSSVFKIDLFNGLGFKLNKMEIEYIFYCATRNMEKKTVKKVGKTVDMNVKTVYNECYKKYSKHIDFKLKDKKILVDCSNGSSYGMIKYLLDKLGAKVDYINCDDLSNLSVDDSEELAKVKQLAFIGNYDLAFVFDRSASDFVLIDDSGLSYSGAKLLYAIAKELSLKSISVSKYLNHNFATHLYNAGIKGKSFAKIGDQSLYDVCDYSAKTKAMINEFSKSVIFDYQKTFDGVLTCVLICKILNKNSFNIDSIFPKDIQSVFRKIIYLNQSSTFDVCDFKKTVQNSEKRLLMKGRIQYFYSQNEGVVFLVVESDDALEGRIVFEELSNYLIG